VRTSALGIFAAILATAACGGLASSAPARGSYEPFRGQLKIGDAAVPVQGAAVTLEFFSSAGIQPLVGRFPIDGDRSSSTRVVVLSHDLWTERFGAAPAAVGRIVELDEQPVTVVGVAPPGFAFPPGTQVWVPQSTVAQK
jgi:putative ABC transport system permease protein